MKLRFSDCDGPTGLYATAGEEILPLDSAAGATAFVGAATQAGTIDPVQSAGIPRAVDTAMRHAIKRRRD